MRNSNILCPKEQVLLNLKLLLQVIRSFCYCLRQNDLFNAGYMLCLFPEHHFEIGLIYIFQKTVGLRTFSMEIFILNGLSYVNYRQLKIVC